MCNKSSEIRRPVLQLRVTLQGTEPAVWRRLLVPSTMSLWQLHEVIQVTMGWMHSHLCLFYVGGSVFGRPDWVDDPEDWQDARKAKLSSFLRQGGDSIRYIYDLGDGWEHDITVEESLLETKCRLPRCLAGENAAPPEDCGGIPGFHSLKEVLADPDDDEHQEMLDWLDGLYPNYDPYEFSLGAVNRILNAGASKYLRLMAKLCE